ncbi:MAG: type II secretion system protein, partial [Planctomycetota bacterium]
MRPRRSAFTLVELLVVVGIIALLVTILMPSLQRAMMLARMAVCGANLHHVYLGVRLYGEEYGVYPGARVGEKDIAFGSDQVHMTLPGQLCPEFTEDPELFWCPAEKRTLAGTPHPFFEGPGGTFGAMQHAAYKVGSPEWRDNVQNRRLAWGTFGTTYAVPMNVLGHLYGLFDNKHLTQHNWWSADGAIDRESFDRNPDAL